MVLAAFVLRRKVILHESDSRMGIANKIASRLASTVCVAFPNLLKEGDKYLMTGNPIRPEIAKGKATQGYRITGFNPQMPVLLVWGGSQGAAEINEMIEDDFENFTREFQIIHITGKGKSIRKKNSNYIHFEYLDEDLKHIYAIADLVIGRAGANSLYELAFLKKPNIIIPLGNSDQLNNARYFEQEGASLVLKTNNRLFDLAHELWQNKALQEEMKKSLSKISGTGANEKLVKIILGL